jgi:hypothetical protein
MKSAVNQRRKLTTAPVVTPARVVKERAPLPTIGTIELSEGGTCQKRVFCVLYR